MKKFISKKILAVKARIKSKLGLNVQIRNLGWNGQPKKRVLLSYLTDALKNDIAVFKYNTNRQECLVLVTSLIKQGYVVDVVDCTDNSFISGIEYDYIIGFGVPFRTAKLEKNGKRILYCTEKHPEFSFKEEQKRIDYLYNRHGVKWGIQRSGRYYLEVDYTLADEFVVMGQKTAAFIKEKYKLPSSLLHCIEPTAINVESISAMKSQRGFLWLGSSGVVHKGLDLLLESFLLADLECELHICGAVEKDVSFLGAALGDPRIKFHGVIDINSGLFNRILERVQYVVLPSCSEGVATSVLTGMGCGLIPLVTDACDIEAKGVGFKIESIDIESIAGVLKLAFYQDDSSVKELSTNAIARVKNHNSISAFEGSIERIFKGVF
ncbi:MAG: glycosyltransferase [Colwellia sp.]|jgi:Glycosyltransferase